MLNVDESVRISVFDQHIILSKKLDLCTSVFSNINLRTVLGYNWLFMGYIGRQSSRDLIFLEKFDAVARYNKTSKVP